MYFFFFFPKGFSHLLIALLKVVLVFPLETLTWEQHGGIALSYLALQICCVLSYTHLSSPALSVSMNRLSGNPYTVDGGSQHSPSGAQETFLFQVVYMDFVTYATL